MKKNNIVGLMITKKKPFTLKILQQNIQYTNENIVFLKLIKVLPRNS